MNQYRIDENRSIKMIRIQTSEYMSKWKKEYNKIGYRKKNRSKPKLFMKFLLKFTNLKKSKDFIKRPKKKKKVKTNGVGKMIENLPKIINLKIIN